MDEDPAGGVRRKKDSSLVRAAELVRDGKRVRHGLRREHGRDDGLGAAADGPPARRRAPVHRHPPAPPRAHAGGARRRRGQRRVHRRHAGPVRRDGRRLRLRPLRDRGADGGRCSPSARSRRRARRWSRRPMACSAAPRRRDSSSSATSRAGTSSPRRPTWWSPTASPGTSPSRRSRARCGSSSTPCWRLRHRRRDQARLRTRSCPHILPLAAELEPENTGGALLLGTDGVCVISHGSSNAAAVIERDPRGPRMRRAGPRRPCRRGRAPSSKSLKSQVRT